MMVLLSKEIFHLRVRHAEGRSASLRPQSLLLLPPLLGVSTVLLLEVALATQDTTPLP